MNDLPPELDSRRDTIHDRVVSHGRARRRRRHAVVALVVAAVIGLPVAAVGLNTHDAGRRVIAVAPTTSLAPTTSSEVPTTATTLVPSTSTSSSTPTGPLTTPSFPTTTTTLVCHNSTDPACGPFSYDPPLTNQPATMKLTVEPTIPRVGQTTTFVVHVTDPDSPISSSYFCGTTSFGDSQETRCIADCAGPGSRYGPWSPPPAEPGDATFRVDHTYKKSGTLHVTIATTADQCGERPSDATASVTVHVSP